MGGLFKIIAASGTVKNVVLKDVRIVSGYGVNNQLCGAAAIASRCSGAVENCSAYGTITSTASGYLNGAAGLVSHLNGGRISDCYSGMDISSDNGIASSSQASGKEANFGVGGIAAKVDGATAVVERCGNGGTINVPNLFFVAGVIGGSQNAGVTISECCNTGNITGGWNVSGVVSWLWGKLRVVYNTGNIHATHATAAGLVSTSAGAGSTASYTAGTVSCGDTTDATTGLAYSLANATAAKVGNFIYPQFAEGITYPVGQSTGLAVGTAMTPDEIKTQETADILNGWTGTETYVLDDSINDGYPVFGWQK